MKNPIREMVTKRQLGIHSGIPDFCSADKLVIEAILEQALRFDDYAVIEATSNQVNQFGGYKKMKSEDFREYVYRIADRIGFSRDKVILGGDHLGPLPWADRPAAEAMENAKELVRQCVLAGYKKVHLDTSMMLGDDDRSVRLPNETIAERGAVLYKVADDAFKELKKKDPDAVHPVYVIGSEVPIPGGSQEEEDTVKVTDPEDFEATLLAYKKKFNELGMDDAWEHIIAVVVQPGVEFGNEDIHKYDRVDARKLCQKLKEYPDIVFEGHSTDYQPPELLKQMVEDGIAILKVGPALTYALREALFALSMIEKELIPEKQRANYIETVEKVMTEDPKEWEKYYYGDERQLKIQRKYSFSDRSRYYTSLPEVVDSMNRLFANLDSIEIPVMMIHQYLPLQYPKVRDGALEPKARELAKDNVKILVEDYNYAVKFNYMIGGVFNH
ncbi:MAG: class II D-tagatose-bisphosphate aldolase non-catalytic subunit [Anaerovoracaceae bacterium]|jgi:D-tagatose-1,6-bisphosphate aldolase subunit GatZ/KbaZ